MTRFVIKRNGRGYAMGLAQIVPQLTHFRGMLKHLRNEQTPVYPTGRARFIEWRAEFNHAALVGRLEVEAQQWADAHRDELKRHNDEVLLPIARGLCPTHGYVHDHIAGEDDEYTPEPTLQ